jgi:molybdate transport system substrate-binding protein
MLKARPLGTIVMIGSLSLIPAADAAELKVIVATPMTGVVQDLAPRFERETGHKIAARYVSGPIVKREIDAGARYDAAVSITPVIDALVSESKLQAESRADVAYALIGVGVRAGAHKPDVSTVEAFKRALLNARSVAHSATGASGDHFRAIIERLGIAEEMKPKLRPMPADTIAHAVPSGQAEMIVVTASVIMVPGTDFVGPIPAELQFYNRFAGGLGADGQNKDAARAFLNLLVSPSAAATYKAHGMEQGVPK